MPKEKTHKIIHEEKKKKLFVMYQELRDLREANIAEADLYAILDTLQKEYPEDWLLSAEILEYAAKTNDTALKKKVSSYLDQIISDYPEYTHLIENVRGL